MLLIEFYCPSCKTHKQIHISTGGPYPDICPDCARAKAEKEKFEFLNNRKRLSLDQRISLIEEELFENRGKNDNSSSKFFKILS